MVKNFWYILILHICFTAPCLSQKHDNIWLIGYGGRNTHPEYGNAFLQFPLDTSTFQKEPMGRADTDFTNIAMCNEEGALQFYTDGLFLYNKLHQNMAGTDSLTHGELAYFDTPQKLVVLPNQTIKTNTSSFMSVLIFLVV
ncbi:MAG: hypothetical protein IPO14_10465 [Saprospiraceae bacterium]|nr:hypothetical protein [Saprospiraceae bacterium]